MQSIPNWSDVTLADVCTLRTESVEPGKATTLHYVGLEHIDTGQPKLRRHGSPAEVRSLKNRFYAGDILYGKLRPYLDKAVCAEYEGICSTDILVFAPQSSILSPFLIHLIHTPALLEHAVKTTKGVNHPRTSWHSLAAFRFRLPPIVEQRAIAEALDALQKAKEARQREAVLERERKAALMEYLFTHGTHGEPTKQTEIGELPKSWHATKIDSTIRLKQYGLSVRGNSTGAVPILRMNNIVEGKVDLTVLQWVDLDARTQAAYILRPGDVLFNRTNSQDLVGKTGLFNHDGAYVFASYLVRLTFDHSVAVGSFMNTYLNLISTQRRLKGMASRGVSQSNISAGKLGNFLVPLPPLEEQREIATVSDAFDRKIGLLEKERDMLDELFQAMLEELMTGRLSALPLIEEHHLP